MREIQICVSSLDHSSKMSSIKCWLSRVDFSNINIQLIRCKLEICFIMEDAESSELCISSLKLYKHLRRTHTWEFSVHLELANRRTAVCPLPVWSCSTPFYYLPVNFIFYFTEEHRMTGRSIWNTELHSNSLNFGSRKDSLKFTS